MGEQNTKIYILIWMFGTFIGFLTGEVVRHILQMFS